MIGIDPGLTGAVAAIDHRGLRALHDMPTMARSAGGASVSHQVNAAALANILQELAAEHDKNEVLILIERVSGMPKQAMGSTFSLGLTAGLIEGAAAARGYAHELVAAPTWKKHHGIRAPKQPTLAKEQARAIAQRLYPAAELHLKKHHNRAEAILIARYGLDTKA